MKKNFDDFYGKKCKQYQKKTTRYYRIPYFESGVQNTESQQNLGLFSFDSYIKYSDRQLWQAHQEHKKFVENNFHNFNNSENSNNSLKLTNLNSCFPAMNSYRNSGDNTPRDRSRSKERNSDVASRRQSIENTSLNNNKNLF